MEVIIEVSKCSLCNEVVCFIFFDLDKVVMLMDGIDFVIIWINCDLVLLFKLCVVLYEGIFLKYFKGIVFVFNGEGWLGKSKEYNVNYEYLSGNIDNEINFFLDEVMVVFKEVVEKYKGQLIVNIGML